VFTNEHGLEPVRFTPQGNCGWRKSFSGPEVKADLSLLQLQTRVEGAPRPGLEALQHRAPAAAQERLGRAGADPLAGDGLPDPELAAGPPRATAVGLLLLEDLGVAERTGTEPARGLLRGLFTPGRACTVTRASRSRACARLRATARWLGSLGPRRPLRPA